MTDHHTYKKRIKRTAAISLEIIFMAQILFRCIGHTRRHGDKVRLDRSRRRRGRCEIVREKKRHPKMPFILLSAIYTLTLIAPNCFAGIAAKRQLSLP